MNLHIVMSMHLTGGDTVYTHVPVRAAVCQVRQFAVIMCAEWICIA